MDIYGYLLFMDGILFPCYIILASSYLNILATGNSEQRKSKKETPLI